LKGSSAPRRKPWPGLCAERRRGGKRSFIFDRPPQSSTCRLHLIANRSSQPQLLKSLPRNMRHLIGSRKTASRRSPLSTCRQMVFVTVDNQWRTARLRKKYSSARSMHSCQSASRVVLRSGFHRRHHTDTIFTGVRLPIITFIHVRETQFAEYMSNCGVGIRQEGVDPGILLRSFANFPMFYNPYIWSILSQKAICNNLFPSVFKRFFLYFLDKLVYAC